MNNENPNQTVERLALNSFVFKDETGKNFSRERLIPVIDERGVAPLRVNTLTGLADYINSDLDKDFYKDQVLLIVDDEETATLVMKLDETTKFRHKIAQANLGEFAGFPFNDFIEAESFIIKLKAMFKDSDDQKTILQYVSRITNGESVTNEDDGVTQSTVLRKGMSGALKENAKAPAMVNLKPFRTFREIEQPESLFLFRMRQSHNGGVQCGLFEADGGTWRIKAMASIQQFLTKKVEGITTIA